MAQNSSIGSIRQLLGLGGITVLLGACGAAIPPQELVDARAAYQQAVESPASEWAPAKLDTARQSLEEAEAAFEDDPDSELTRDLAYIAERRARASAAAGQREQNKRRLAQLEAEYQELERKQANMTKEELEKMRARLEEERRRAAAGEQALAQKDEALAQKEAEIEREREARKAAEGKLSAAIASLKEMGSVKEESRGVVITLSGSVLFATGEYNLLPIAKEKLNEVATALKDQGYKKIVIEGHTDSRGSAAKNQELSLQRAQSVKAHLVTQGMDASKIEAVGLGPDRPVATNDTAEGRAMNRRVELVVEPE
ncbi:MAG: OmpA family protein [Myxococcales bacterium]|jgi:outer membrane protein OmpA-like peptidoglycan-associated protein|nr:OmpA family protein [Myxococcales bacterium]